MLQNALSRLWFLSQGCKQVPLEYARGIVRWGHPDGYLLNAQGQKVPNDNRNPSSINPTWKSHGCYPKDRTTNKLMHLLMALAFYGDRPTYTDKNGKPYVGICHHLIPDKLDYRPDNLLCWLTYSEHGKADSRRRALEAIVPDHNLHVLSYDRLRHLQNPRTLSDDDFQTELANLRDAFKNNLHRTDPLDLAARDIDKYR